jgi:hypothetical protein
MYTRFTFELAGVGSLLCLGACFLSGEADDAESSDATTASATEGDAGTDTSPGSTAADASGSESATTDDTVDGTSGDDSDDDGSDTTGNDPGEPIVLVDCGANENGDMPQCDNYPDVGTIGMGPPMYGDSQIYAGFLDGSSLYVAVDLGDEPDDIGGVMRIDLPTGERTWVAGNHRYEDDGEVTMLGAGAEIGAMRGLARLSDGRVMAYRGEESDNDSGLFEVDLQTGDRTDFALAVDGRYTCEGLGFQLGAKAQLAPGTDGDFYIAGGVAGDESLLRFGSDGSCTIVSRSGDAEAGDIGMGPEFGGLAEGLEMHDGLLYGLVGFGYRDLFTIDPTTGDRTLLSSDGAKVGTGPELGADSLDVTADRIWTTGDVSQIEPMTSVDPVTGDRTDELVSPLYGPIWGGVADIKPEIFVYGDQIVFELGGGGIGVYEPATKNSNWISI